MGVIALSDPALINVPWEINGKICQREVIALGPNGAPSAVQILCEVSPQVRPYILKSGSHFDRSPEWNDDLNWAVLLSTHGKTYTSVMGQHEKVLKRGKYLVEKRFFSQLVSPDGEKIMGVHAYCSSYSNGAKEITLRISNAVLDTAHGFAFNGAVFYDSLGVMISGQRYILAAPLAGGMQHLFLPQAQTIRRYYFGKLPVFCRTLGSNGYHTVGAFGAERQKLPNIPDEFHYGSYVGWAALDKKASDLAANMKHCFYTGTSNDNIEMFTNALGPFHPMLLGDSGSGAPGGSHIYPCLGHYQTKNGVEMLKLRHRATMDRMATIVIDQNGEALTCYDFSAGNNGVNPFYFNIIGGWKFNWDTNQYTLEQAQTLPYYIANVGKPFNVGTCPYLGSKYSGGLMSYEYHDDAHFSRASVYPKSLVYLANDSCAKDDLISFANFIHMGSYTEFPHGNDYWIQHSHSVWKFLEYANLHPGVGNYIERAYGWAMDTIAQAYPLANSGWRTQHLVWFQKCAEMLTKTMMPSGLVERQAGWPTGVAPGGHLVETAVPEGFPHDQDLAGAIYIGIVCQGIGAMLRGALGTHAGLTTILDKIIHNVFQYSPYTNGPAYFMSVAPIGGVPYTHPMHFNTNGHAETFNFWWAAMHAYVATLKEEHIGRLKTYKHPSMTSHQEHMKKIFQDGSGWDDIIPNAAYYLAEAQRRRD
jgi:hypothetical protein